MSLRQIGLSALAASILTAVCAGRESHPDRVWLLESAEVTQEKITLADLLPASTPSSLQEGAARMSLGSAPQPGSSRTLRGYQIERQLRSSPDILALLAIPDRIVVTRAFRAISHAEIARAIEAALNEEGFSGNGPLNPGNVELEAPVLVTRDDLGLKATRLEYDRLEHRAVFRLWASKEPHLLPFYVSVDSLPGADLLAGRGALSGKSVMRGSAQPRVLVKPGKPVRMLGEGRNFRFSTIVVPLQPGRKGEIIRVRERGTRRLLKAEVTGEGILKAQFQ
jgi:hypothetical protein